MNVAVNRSPFSFVASLSLICSQEEHLRTKPVGLVWLSSTAQGAGWAASGRVSFIEFREGGPYATTQIPEGGALKKVSVHPPSG